MACWPSPYGDTAEATYKEIGATSLDPNLRPGKTTVQPAANVLYKTSYNPALRPDLDGILAKRRDATPVDAEDAEYGYYKNWCWTWMLNQRILYNINESNAGLKTFFVWWATSETEFLGLDRAAIWSKPVSAVHGIPEHNEPVESPDAQLASEYPTLWDDRFPVTKGSREQYPHVFTTFRLTEHMQAGALTRNLPWLVELHPECFVEIDPSLASELGVESGDQVVIKTARNPGGETVKAIVTDRVPPLVINGKVTHTVAMPWHWGFKGLSTGPSANTLCIDAVDVHAQIPETKACLCSVEKA
jgi:formate dehydrogenase major subunit